MINFIVIELSNAKFCDKHSNFLAPKHKRQMFLPYFFLLHQFYFF